MTFTARTALIDTITARHAGVVREPHRRGSDLTLEDLQSRRQIKQSFGRLLGVVKLCSNPGEK